MKHTIEVTSRELGVLSWALADLYTFQRENGIDGAGNDSDVLVTLGDRIFEQFRQPGVVEDAVAEREAAIANEN